MTNETALTELKHPEVPPTGSENHHYLEKVLEEMQTLKNYLWWYNNKNVVLNLEVV